MLEIKDLHVSIEGTPILCGVNLTICPGEIHALMGPNGAGKSTLARVLAGDSAYEVTRGDIVFQGESLLEKEPEERAARGLFMGFQYPPEISGVNTRTFLFHACNAIRKNRGLEPLHDAAFDELLLQKMAFVQMRTEFKERNVNEGFSGGEKKRCEILQMAILEPVLAILDETDSGLDIDALRIVAEGVNRLMHPERALLVITHYQRLLDFIKPHYVHIFAEGRIIRSGDASLAVALEQRGYDHFRDA